MAENNLGLTFEINADPSQAQAALAQFESSTGTSFRNASIATQPFNDSLLTNRESVRLLSEEVGVHLPRAVSSAIAEILPNIASMGTALLAVFAVEEVVKWGKAAVEEMHELQGETKELKKEWEGVIAEQEKLLRDPKTLQDAQKDLDESNKRLADLAKHIADLKAEQASLSPILVGAIAGYAKALSDAEDEQTKLLDRERAQEDTKVKLLHKAEQDGNEAAKAVLENYRQQEKAAKDAAKTQEQLANEAAENVLRNYREQQKALLAWAHGQEEVKKLDQDHIQRMREEDGWWIRIEGDIAKEGKALENEHHAMEILNRQRDELFKHSKQLQQEYRETHLVLDDFTKGIQEQTQAISQNQAAYAAQLAEGLAGLIGGQKAAAIFKAGYEIAEGIACLASGTWPPNPPAIIAAGLHFEAAAQYAMMGGGGGGGRRSASASSGNQSDYGRGGGSSGAGSGGPGQPGSGRGPTIILNQYGPVVGTWADAGKAMANVLNQLTQTGQCKLISTSALTNGPKLT